MADQKLISLLKSGVPEWNEWRRGNPQVICPDLSSANLSAINLNDANLSHANLAGANLQSTTLFHANLSKATLAGANLSNAVLFDCELVDANLAGTDFTGAFLNGAHLNQSDLSNADFTGANLSRADLSWSTLNNTNFREAGFGFTLLCDLDLRRALNLDSVHHSGPSSIGIDTIYLSEGDIPETFMREAGTPEPFVIQARSLVAAMAPLQFYSCFISYSHADKEFARILYDRLQKAGIRCWLDEHQLLPGDDIYHQVDRAIRLWDKLLLCCSEHSLQSWWVDHEVGTAFEKEQQLSKERGRKVHALIPLNLDDYLFTKWQSGYAAQVRRRLAADFVGIQSTPKKFDEQIDKLIRALRADEGNREAAPASKL